MKCANFAKWIVAVSLAWPLGLTTGCAYQNLKQDVDDTPQVHTGVGASILYPGGRPPVFPQSPPPGAGGGTQSYNTRNGQTQGQNQSRGGHDPERSGGGLTYLGGNQGQETSSRTIKQEPHALKAVKVPVAIAAYPFKKAADVLRGKPKPVEQPEAAPEAPRGDDVHAAHESNELEAMEKELSSRAPVRRSAPVAQRQSPTQSTRSGGGSLADELAALRGRGVQVSALPSGGRSPNEVRANAPSRAQHADRVADRNHDGRPDHWSYVEAGQIGREEFDDNGDGLPDRTVHYDPATGERRRVEEDRNEDGLIDTWVDYQDGAIARRRGDADGDGTVDRWTFFRRGKIVRIEEDLDGDGFRDRIGHYEAGKVKREEEDRDGDGTIDVRSFYEDGKLARREMIEGEAHAPAEEPGLRLDPAFGDS